MLSLVLCSLLVQLWPYQRLPSAVYWDWASISLWWYSSGNGSDSLGSAESKITMHMTGCKWQRPKLVAGKTRSRWHHRTHSLPGPGRAEEVLYGQAGDLYKVELVLWIRGKTLLTLPTDRKINVPDNVHTYLDDPILNISFKKLGLADDIDGIEFPATSWTAQLNTML